MNVPESIARYKIERELGKGAMGVVYLATDPTIGRKVALKTMRVDVQGLEGEELLKRFRNEARAAGVLNHPNLVTIYDAGEIEGLFYIAMECIDGVTLQRRIVEKGVLSADEIADVARQVCAGLDYAHSKGVIHRDVKPANIMITPDGTVKIMDFGIAKAGSGMTSTGHVVGTPNYMSPEQVRGKALDGRSDLFSVGVVLYEMATGERPFTGQNVTTIIYKIVNEHPPSPRDLDATVPGGLSAIVMKALAKAPDERYQKGADLVKDLQNYKQIGADMPTVTRVDVPAQRATGGSSDIVPPGPGSGMDTLIPSSGVTPIPTMRTPVLAADTGSSTAVTGAASTGSRAAGPASTGAAAKSALVGEETVLRPAPGPQTIARKVAPPPPKRNYRAVVAVAGVIFVLLLAGAVVRNRRMKQAALAPPIPAPTAQPAPAEATSPAPARHTPPATSAGAPKAENPGSEPARSAAATAVGMGELAISSNPDGAAVQIDGRSNPKWTTPMVSPKLKAGHHTVTFSKDGFNPENREIDVAANKTVILAAGLKPIKATYAVSSDPAGAAILLDGADTGQVTPAQISVAPGQHQLTLRKQGFVAEQIVADAGPGQSLNFSPTLKPAKRPAVAAQNGGPQPGQQPTPPPTDTDPFAKGGNRFTRLFGGGNKDKGTLEVRTHPDGAEIWFGQNQTPLKTPARFPINAGTYRLILHMQGYKPVIRVITIEKGKLTGVEETLEQQ